MIKKRVGVLTILSLFLWAAVPRPAAQEAGYTYTTTNSTITITRYTGPGGPVTIPSMINGLPVTSIGNSAFYRCSGLTSVTIPNSVTSIGNDAFRSCSGLTALTVDTPNLAYSSLDGVLFNKSQTTLIQFPGGKAGNYTIPNSVTRIGDSAFSGCSGLTSTTIPNSITSIGDLAFRGCYGLTSTTIPNSVTSIGFAAFANCYGLTSITIPNSVTSIGRGAFLLCYGLTILTMGNSVTSIGDSAFANCYGLTDVTIPNSVDSIGNYAFSGCSGLTNLTIPNSVTIIGSGAFDGCSKLVSLFFLGSAPVAGAGALTYPTIVYYLPGTTGWTGDYGGRPIYLWNPAPQTADANFGIRTNRFGFNIKGTPNIPIVVEASENLASQAWVPLETCTLTNGLIYFSDTAWTNFPTRHYRIRSP